MRLGSTALVAIAATLVASCVDRATATSQLPIASLEQLDAVRSPAGALRDDKRFLRTPAADLQGDEEERGFNLFGTKKLAAGAETLSKEDLKKLVDQVLKNPSFYDDLVMADKIRFAETYATWSGLGVTPKVLAKRMTNAGYGGKEYKHFVTGYIDFLNSGIRIQ